MSLRIEDYGLIGDCETACLVGKNGSMDWLCWPDFSSPACFAALVGEKENGRWLIAPGDRVKKTTRRYRDHTLILETRFETSSGVLLLTDFMPIRERHSDVVRVARCVQGRVSVEMELCVRFDYGRTVPWTGPGEGNTWTAAAGTGVVYLRTQERVRTSKSTAFAHFTLRRHEQRSFVLTYVRADEPAPRRINVKAAFSQTEAFWIDWCRRNTYRGPWREAIERSLITLKALTYRPTGGIVAAPTASLPEYQGGNRNFDYRYCWLRDAALTLESFLSAGYHSEAQAWQEWLLQSVGRDVRGMQIMYGIHGERHLPECELPWLRGYEGSSPVRIGNAASEQLQLDVFGEVADALAKMAKAKLHLDARIQTFRTELTNHVASISHKPTSGIWERRSRVEQLTFSKVMAWVALERGIRAARERQIRGTHRIWKAKLTQLHRQICNQGFNRNLRSFVQSFGSNKLDASTLLIPIFGFLPFEDERVRATVIAIEKGLMRNGLIYRYRPESTHEKESAFLACSFWFVQNLAGVGRKSDAENLYATLLCLRNDLGLLPEEYDPERRRFMGNFPQALSHISLINAGWMLSTNLNSGVRPTHKDARP